jgi:uncharacterized protein YxeA
MKKLFKILGIIIATVICVPLIIGVIAVIVDGDIQWETPKVKEEVNKSNLEEIKNALESIDNQKEFDAYFAKVEEIAQGNSSDTLKARDFLKYREGYEISMQQRALDKWVEKAKEEYPKQFSKWDGSNSYLVKALKKAMNDPDSFKHDETRWEYGSGYKYIRVHMKYRGKNAYGAYVRGAIIAKIDINGNILETEHS